VCKRGAPHVFKRGAPHIFKRGVALIQKRSPTKKTYKGAPIINSKEEPHKSSSNSKEEPHKEDPERSPT